jgi:hypothetical protein
VSAEHYIEQMQKLAEVGAALCCYLPGAGDPEAWPESRCDCKRLPDLASILRHEYIQLGAFTSEKTGCCEVREAWRALDGLREQAAAIERAADV